MKLINQTNSIKQISAVLLLCIAFFFSACSSGEKLFEDKDNGNQVTLRFSVGGIKDQTTEMLTRSGRISEEAFSKDEGSGLMVSCTLDLDTASTSKTRSSSPMASGVHYRIVAYQGTHIMGIADGIAGSQDATLSLLPGTHRIVAYSYNSTSPLPPHDHIHSLSSADDFLWTTVGDKTVTAGATEDISLVFVHQRSVIKVVADASVLVQDADYASLNGVGEIVQDVTALVMSSYNVDFNIITGGMAANGSSNTVIPAWQGIGLSKAPYVEVYTYPIGTAPTHVTFSNIRFSSQPTTHSKTVVFSGKTLVSGCRYTLTAKFRNKCGAFVAPAGQVGSWKEFKCHNLGATTSLNPFVPAAGLHGAKYRFGVKTASLSMVKDQSNAGAVSNWTTLPFQDSGDWSSSNNPCGSSDWRVPTDTEWNNVIVNNAVSFAPNADWTPAADNFSSGRYFGDNLFLPTPGYRRGLEYNGELSSRGKNGYYWSSVDNSLGTTSAYYLLSGDVSLRVANASRTNAFSVRCIRN